MSINRTKALAAASAAIVLTLLAATQLPAIGAGAILRPSRRPVTAALPRACEDVAFNVDIGALRGWRCRPVGDRLGTLVYLHGIADNRGSSAGVLARYASRGFETVAYDSRAHGESAGDACTYGYFEKHDLRRVLDALEPGPVVLVGTSLGAAVALQHAGGDSRVRAVVAAEAFSDLRTVATERAPFIFTPPFIERAFTRAENEAHFEVDVVSPVAAARSITAPTLIIHGENDTETPPAHAQRIFAALSGRKRLILVTGAGHNQSLSGEIWTEIDRWIEAALPENPRAMASPRLFTPSSRFTLREKQATASSTSRRLRWR